MIHLERVLDINYRVQLPVAVGRNALSFIVDPLSRTFRACRAHLSYFLLCRENKFIANPNPNPNLEHMTDLSEAPSEPPCVPIVSYDFISRQRALSPLDVRAFIMHFHPQT